MVGAPLYEVSDQGHVRNQRGHILKPAQGAQGYLGLSLVGPGWVKVHHLVLAAFVGPRPQGLLTRHLDGDPANNRLANLTYGTKSENAYDSVAHGTHPQASKTECIHGHEFTPANTHTYQGRRICRTCKRDVTRRVRARKRAVATGGGTSCYGAQR